MAKPIEVLSNHINLSVFDSCPFRTYKKENLPLKQVIDTAERWLILDGSVTFKDDLNGKIHEANTGDVIILPPKSGFSGMKFMQDCKIKQYIDDDAVRNETISNIIANYLIVETILNVIDIYYEFTNVPYETDWLFECAREGKLYKFTEDWSLIDATIQNFVGRTGLSENVWYGRRRLKTGLRYNRPDWDDTATIDFVDLSNDPQLILYNDIKEDPLDLRSFDPAPYNHNVHTLENLILLYARNIRDEEEEIFENAFPSDIVLRQPRNSGPHLTKKGMPNYILYGRELAELIRRLFWCTSIGYQNRDNYKAFVKKHSI